MISSARIILASASPRRRELLGRICPEFEVIVSSAEENPPAGLSPAACAAWNARAKAQTVAQSHADALVIGADTIVVLDGRIFGKPTDADSAHEMLATLSGKTHKVITAVCLVQGASTREFFESTKVRFRRLSHAEIEEYIATGEPFDKAGAYGIQGKGGALVAVIDGDFDNVVGLPVKALQRELGL